MDKFLETYNLSKWNYKEIENLNRPVISKEIESVIKNPPTKKSPGPGGFAYKYYQTFKELMSIFFKLFQKRIEGERTLSSLSHKAIIILMSK